MTGYLGCIFDIRPLYILGIILCFLVGGLCFMPTTGWAQSPGLPFLDGLGISPQVGHLKARFNYQGTFYPAEDVKGQYTDFKLFEHQASVGVPLYQDDRREWSLSSNLNYQKIETGAILPDTGQKFPGELWNVNLGSSYRQLLSNGWISGISLSVGSASDRPFASIDETVVTTNLSVRVPAGGRNAWLFLVNFSNNREFLNYIPIPGVGYWYEPNNRVQAMIGIPFVFLRVKPYENLSFDLFYLPINTVHAGATLRVSRPVQLYTAFDWATQRYFLADRQEQKDRLFYYEKRISAGIRIHVADPVTLDLSGGYAFDRFYFEGENYSDTGRNRVDLADGPFFWARVLFLF